MGWGGWSSLSRVGSGDGVSCGGRGRGDSRLACVGGGINVNWLVLAAACCVRGLVSGGGGGGGGVWGWRCWWTGGAGVSVMLDGGLGVSVGRVGVACVRRAVPAVLGWFWCRGVGGRRPHGRPGGAVVRM